MAHFSCTPKPRRTLGQALWEEVSTSTKEKAVGGMGSPGIPRWSFQPSSFCGAGLYLPKGRTLPACLPLQRQDWLPSENKFSSCLKPCSQFLSSVFTSQSLVPQFHCAFARLRNLFAPGTFPRKDTSALQSAQLSSILISHIKKNSFSATVCTVHKQLCLKMWGTGYNSTLTCEPETSSSPKLP